MHVARDYERFLRLQSQFRISLSFRPRNPAKARIKNPFWDSPKGTHPFFNPIHAFTLNGLHNSKFKFHSNKVHVIENRSM